MRKYLNIFKKPLILGDIEHLFVCLSEYAELVKLFFKYNSDTDLVNIFTNIYNSLPKKKMMKAFQNLNENSAKLLYAYLTGGAYFLTHRWIMNDIPMQPKEVAAIALNILNQNRIF